MKKFEFDIAVYAPTKEDAVDKMKSLTALGKHEISKIKSLTALGEHLSLSELKALENTVSSPTALAPKANWV
jgi:hypothetical protein